MHSCNVGPTCSACTVVAPPTEVTEACNIICAFFVQFKHEWLKRWTVLPVGAVGQPGLALLPIGDLLDHDPGHHVAWHTGASGTDAFHFVTYTPVKQVCIDHTNKLSIERREISSSTVAIINDEGYTISVYSFIVRD